MGTAFLNSLSVISTNDCCILLFTCLEKSFHVGSGTFTTENFKWMVRLKKFPLQKALEDVHGQLITIFRILWKDESVEHHTARPRRQLAMTAEWVTMRWTQHNRVARKPGMGPSSRTTPWDDRMILRLALTITTAEIRAGVTGKVSPRTLGNKLLEIGSSSRVTMRCLPLTPCHRQHRPAWCTARNNWGIEWHSVVFSDGLASICVSQIEANVSVDDPVKSHRKQRL